MKSGREVEAHREGEAGEPAHLNQGTHQKWDRAAWVRSEVERLQNWMGKLSAGPRSNRRGYSFPEEALGRGSGS